MPAGFVGLGGASIADSCFCESCDGGIVRIGVLCEFEIADLIIDEDRCVIGISTSAPNVITEYVFDDDNTAFLNETVNETGTCGTTYVTEGFGQYACLSKESIEEGNKLTKVKYPVYFVEYTNGLIRLFGIDSIDNGDGTYSYQRSKTRGKIFVNNLSDTADNQSRLEFNISAEHRNAAMTINRIAGVFDMDIILSY